MSNAGKGLAIRGGASASLFERRTRLEPIMSARRPGLWLASGWPSLPDPLRPVTRSARRRARLSTLPALTFVLGTLGLFAAAPAQAGHLGSRIPTDVAVTAYSGGLQLGWTAATGITPHAYRARWRVKDTDPGTPSNQAGPWQGGTADDGMLSESCPSNSCSHSISGLTNGTNYEVQVALYAFHAHWPSSSVEGTPQAGLPPLPDADVPTSLTHAPDPGAADPGGDIADQDLRPGIKSDLCDLLGEEQKRLYPECLHAPIGEEPGPETVQCTFSNRSACNLSGTGNDPQVFHRPNDAEPQQQAPAPYASLIAQMRDWRNDPQWVSYKSHTDRWDRALLSFGEPVSDTSLTPMTDAEAQGFADSSWGERWVPVAAALKTVMTGTSGADTLTGKSNGELLVGLGGDDTLSGEAGNDELRGGNGDDDLSGGGGADRFVFFSGETGANAITDFSASDMIVLLGTRWSSVADIIASVQAVGSGDYRYTLASGLTVETTNNRSLRTEDFASE